MESAGTSQDWCASSPPIKKTRSLALFPCQRDDAAPIHPKAMPAILTTREEIALWMTAPAEEALKLQRPLADGALRIVGKGGKKDEGGLAA